MSIHVHIDSVVLEGIPIMPQHQGPVLQAALEQELARLLAADGLSSSLTAGGAVPSVAGGTIRLTGESHPADLGRQIAQAVYGGIGR